MTEYIDELTNYSLSTFENRVAGFNYSCTDERALSDLHRSLDLPEAISSQINTIISESICKQSHSKARVWGLTVINLYQHLIAGLSEADRSATWQFVNVGEGEFRLARMCMLIWLHPVEAPRITRALAETSIKWLHLKDYPDQQILESRIAGHLIQFAATLQELHRRMADHIKTLQDKCLYDFYTAP